MNKLFSTLLFFSIALWSFAQGPSFKYQGVARNNQNASLNNQNIALRLTILNAANSPVFSEVHAVKTSEIGIFSVNVCQGTNQNGTCGAIDWALGGYQLKVDMDPAGGATFAPMGVSPILAVPVAAFALKAQSAINGDADSNPQNELQNLTFNSATNNLAISQGNNVDLTSLKNDADADATNEIQTISLDTTNNQLSLSRNGGSIILPGGGASPWKINGNILSYVNGSQSITFDKAGSAPLNQALFEINFRSNAKRRFISGPTDWYDEFWTKPGNAFGKEIAFGSYVKEYPVTYAESYLRFNADSFLRTRITNYTFQPGGSPGVLTEFTAFSQANNNGNPVRVLSAATLGQGGYGSHHAYIANTISATTGNVIINNAITPFVGVWPTTSTVAGIFLMNGQATITAALKNFVMPHPLDPQKEIWYACVEGPEAAAYERGTATLINGESEIIFRADFGLVVNHTTMTIQLTPLSADSEGMAVIEKSANGFKVKELRKGKGNYQFDWEVKGVRKGYENYQAVRPKMVASLPTNQVYDMNQVHPVKTVDK
ncbi:MAG: hypothetical protein WAR77_11425 [Saprospiraceae bacterium]|nr:hypothetical protein [Saprospiraceae bacterium]MBK9729230.1 hypothetical protein [Saprospiraceae bacterium]